MASHAAVSTALAALTSTPAPPVPDGRAAMVCPSAAVARVGGSYALLSLPAGADGALAARALLDAALLPMADALAVAPRQRAEARRALVAAALALDELARGHAVRVPAVAFDHDPGLVARVEALRAAGDAVNADALEDEYQDVSRLNALQARVAAWEAEIARVCGVAREGPGAVLDADEESLFWASVDAALKSAEDALAEPQALVAVQLLARKRRKAGFLVDSKDALASARMRAQGVLALVQSLPVGPLRTADSVPALTAAIRALLAHVVAKLKLSSFPLSRALALVAGLSKDVSGTLCRVLERGGGLLRLSAKAAAEATAQCETLFRAWEDGFEACRAAAVERAEARGETMEKLPARAFAALHARIRDVAQFRGDHEALLGVLHALAGLDDAAAAPAVQRLAEDVSGDGALLAGVEAAFSEVADGIEGAAVFDCSADGEGRWTALLAEYATLVSGPEETLAGAYAAALEAADNLEGKAALGGFFKSVLQRTVFSSAVSIAIPGLLALARAELVTVRARVAECTDIKAMTSGSGDEAWLVPNVTLQLLLVEAIATVRRRVDAVVGATRMETDLDIQDFVTECGALRDALRPMDVVEEWKTQVRRDAFDGPGTVFRLTGVSNLGMSMSRALARVPEEVDVMRDLGFRNALSEDAVYIEKRVSEVWPSYVHLLEGSSAYQVAASKLSSVETSSYSAFRRAHVLVSQQKVRVRNLLRECADLRWVSDAGALQMSSGSLVEQGCGYVNMLYIVAGQDESLMETASYIRDLKVEVGKDGLSEATTRELTNSTNRVHKSFSVIQECSDEVAFETYSQHLIGPVLQESTFSVLSQTLDVWQAALKDRQLGIPAVSLVYNTDLKHLEITPPLQAVEETIYTHLLNTVRAVASESPGFSPESERRTTDTDQSGALTNLVLNFVRDEKHAALFSKVVKEVQRVLAECHDYLVIWFRYEGVWGLHNAGSSQSPSKLSLDEGIELLSSVEDACDHVASSFKSPGQAKSEADSITLVTDTSPAMKEVFNRLQDFKEVVASKCRDSFAIEGNALYQLATETQALLGEAVAGDPMESVILLGSVESEILPSCRSRLSLLEESNVLLSCSSRHENTGDEVDYDAVAAVIKSLRADFASRKRHMEGDMESLKDRFTQESDQFEGDIAALFADMTGLKDEVSDSIDADVVATDLAKMEERFASLQSKSKRMQSIAVALNMTEPSCDMELETLELEIRDMKEAVSEVSELHSSLLSVGGTRFGDMDPKGVMEQLETIAEGLKEFQMKKGGMAIASRLDADVENYISVHSLLSSLKSARLSSPREREVTEKLLGGDHVESGLYNASLKDLLDCGLAKHEAYLNALFESAAGESALAAFLANVAEVWTSRRVSFSCKGKVYLIRGIPELLDDANEHLQALSAMCGSVHARLFESERASWELRLAKFRDQCEVWAEVQTKWLHLNSLFAEGSATASALRRQLAQEFASFKSVHSRLVDFSTKANTASGILEVLEKPSGLDRMAIELAAVVRGLSKYLETERNKFPRFFFLSDEDLLSMLSVSTGNFEDALPHISKLFPGVSTLDVGTDGTVSSNPILTIRGIASKEGERLALREPVTVSQRIQAVSWLQSLEKQIRCTLRSTLPVALVAVERCLYSSSCEGSSSRDLEYFKFPSQMLLLACKIAFTKLVESCFDSGKEHCQALLDLSSTTDTSLLALTRMDVSDVKVTSADGSRDAFDVRIQRVREQLIKELVFQRSVLRALRDEENPCSSISDYSWFGELRFYGSDASNGELHVEASMGNAKLQYGWEYLGIGETLVQTPLTRRCFLTLTEALRRGLGGSPFGPAGTGKTESVKALGRSLGRTVAVFNCDESFDAVSVGRILAGVCRTGSWVCFDEFNRLSAGILSATSNQLALLQAAIQSRTPSVPNFYGGTDVVKVSEGVGVFVTMNPTYTGRRELPGNLTSLFRPFAMAKPDSVVIAEVSLLAQGFSFADPLSEKLVGCFSTLKSSLPNRLHYDFGLRSLKSAIQASGALRRSDAALYSGKAGEHSCIVRALVESVKPKVTADDVDVFKRTLDTCFPGTPWSDPVLPKDLLAAVERVVEDCHVRLTDSLMGKMSELYNILEHRPAVIMMGPSGSGKSTAWRMLQKAMRLCSLKQEVAVENNSLWDERESKYSVVKVIDPKLLSSSQLYGSLDVTTREWTDGLFTQLIRKLGRTEDSPNRGSGHQLYNWIVFDGDVDPDWAENLNSVLDDSRVLTLATGERLPLPETVRIVFEAENVKYANPSTISRCGMVCFSTGDTLEMSAHKLADDLASNSLFHAACVKAIRPLVPVSSRVAGSLDSYGEPVMSVSEAGVLGSVYACFSASLGCFMHRFRSWTTGANDGTEKKLMVKALDENEYLISRFAVRAFLVALVSGAGGPLSSLSRTKLSEAVLKMATEIDDLERGADDLPQDCDLFSVFVDPESGNYISFGSLLSPFDSGDANPLSVGDPDIVVPTVTTLRNSSKLSDLLAGECESIVTLVGPPGCGKSMVISDALKSLPNVELASMSFSSTTTAKDILATLHAHAAVHKLPSGDLCLRPKTQGFRIVLFCDEINLGCPDAYGTQAAACFLRQLVEKRGYWSENALSWVRVENVQIVAACNPPEVSGRQSLPMRFLRHMYVVRVEAPSSDDMATIFGALNGVLLSAVDPNLASYSDAMTQAMIHVYEGNRDRFAPAVGGPLQPHYVYSPRDLSRWLRGMRQILLERDELSDSEKSREQAAASSMFVSSDAPVSSSTRSGGSSSVSLGDVVSALVHEARRLFGDRLVRDEEREFAESLLLDSLTTHLGFKGSKLADQWYSAWPKKHKKSSHKGSKGESLYVPVKDVSSLRKLVYRKLRAFSEQEGLGGSHLSGHGATGSRSSMIDQFAVTDDVLQHLTRIERILRSPLGHAVLIGAPGSGKKTLARFAAWMGGLTVHQVRSHSNYSAEDFANDLRNVLRTAGVANTRIMMIFDESNALDGEFLEMMNAILACGDVPGLFEGEDRVSLLASLRKKRYGMASSSTDEALYKSFIHRVRNNLHIVFTLTCDSKVAADDAGSGGVAIGAELLTRSPALYNRCVVDWMGNWDSATLGAVAELKLEVFGGVEKEAVVRASVHIHDAAAKYLEHCEGAARLATPRHYLEFVEQMNRITLEKASGVQDLASRLTSGLERIRQAGTQVDTLKDSLGEKAELLAEKERKANETLAAMAEEQRLAEKAKVSAEEHAIQAERAAEAAAEREQEVAEHLAEVQPKIDAARDAVGSIRKENLDELRAMPNPPSGVRLALQAVLMMLDASQNRPSGAMKWPSMRSRLRGGDLIPSVLNFDPDSLRPDVITKLRKEVLSNPDFDVQKICYSSRAAGPLAEWTMASMEYAEVNRSVAPLREEAVQLEQEQEACLEQKAEAEGLVVELAEKVKSCQVEYAGIVSEAESMRKEIAQAERRIGDAEKTLESLGDEWDRWNVELGKCNEMADFVWGDAVLGAAFVSYAGVLDEGLRKKALCDWRDVLTRVGMSFSDDLVMGEYLSTDMDRRIWADAGLPMDEASIQSYGILKRSARYPLLVDPSRRMDTAVRAVVMSAVAGSRESAAAAAAAEGDENQIENAGKGGNRMEKNSLAKTSFASTGKHSYLRVMESSMRFGTAVLVEDADQFDLSVAPVLGQEASTGDASETMSLDSGTTNGSTGQGGGNLCQRLVRLGDRDVDQSPMFRMFLSTTDLWRTPAAAVTRCCVVSFSFSKSTMLSTCLSRTLESLLPNLERQRSELTASRRLHDERKQALEGDMLSAITASSDDTEDMLEGPLLGTLQRLKEEAESNASKMAQHEAVSQELTSVMHKYEPFAAFSVRLYLAVRRLSSLNPLYCFSAEDFLNIFEACVARARAACADAPVADQTATLKGELFPALLRHVAPSLFPDDRAPFAADLALVDALPEPDVPAALSALHSTLAAGLPPPDPTSPDPTRPPVPDAPLPLLSPSTPAPAARVRAAVATLSSRLPAPCPSILHGDECSGEHALRGALAHYASSTASSAPARVRPLLLCARGAGVDPAALAAGLCRELGLSVESAAVGDADSAAGARSALDYAAAKWGGAKRRRAGAMLLKNMHLAPPACVEVVRREILRHHGALPYALVLTCEVPSTPPAALVALAHPCRPLAFQAPPAFIPTLLRAASTAASTPAPPPARTHLAWLHASLSELSRYAPAGLHRRAPFADADLAAALSAAAALPPGAPALAHFVADAVYAARVAHPHDERAVRARVCHALQACPADAPRVCVVQHDDVWLPVDARPLAAAVARLPQPPARWFGLPEGAEDERGVRDGWEGLQRLAKLHGGQ